MRPILLALAFVFPVLASPAYPADKTMRPGLWEITTTSDLLKLVPRIPPDQMQQLMDLAKQHGFDVPQIQNGAAVSRVCVSQEMADRDKLPDFLQNPSGCTAKNASHTGNTYRLDFVCADARLKGNGTAEAVFASPERFSGRTSFEGVAQGNPVNEHADISGLWINNMDCGAVKVPQ